MRNNLVLVMVFASFVSLCIWQSEPNVLALHWDKLSHLLMGHKFTVLVQEHEMLGYIELNLKGFLG